MKKILLLLLVLPFTLHAQLTDSLTRVIKMEGAVNFRDVGNYKTLDGKTVVNPKLLDTRQTRCRPEQQRYTGASFPFDRA